MKVDYHEVQDRIVRGPTLFLTCPLVCVPAKAGDGSDSVLYQKPRHLDLEGDLKKLIQTISLEHIKL